MQCKTCGHLLAAEDSACPACRTPVVRAVAAPARPSRVRKLWHLAIAIAIGLLPLVPHVIDWLQVRLPLRTSPLVREALQRVTDDPRVVATLGQPVHAGWSVLGYIRSDETGWSEGRLWIPISGPKGEATVYARAGRGSGPWIFTALECRFKQGSSINFLDPSPAPVGLSPRGEIHLVRLGQRRYVPLDPLRDYYRAHLGVSVNVLGPISVDPNAFDPRRGQFVADRVIAS